MSTQPSRRPSGHDDDSVPGGTGREEPTRDGARESRLAAVVEAFLRTIRSGGSLDPEPYLMRCEDLRAELEPLLLGVLRLESLANALGGRSGPGGPPAAGPAAPGDAGETGERGEARDGPS